MKQYLIIPAAISFAAFNCVPIAYAASFDCRQAIRLQDKFICQHVAISKLDEELARAYRAQMKSLSKEGQAAGFVNVEVPLALVRPHLTPLARDRMASNPR